MYIPVLLLASGLLGATFSGYVSEWSGFVIMAGFTVLTVAYLKVKDAALGKAFWKIGIMMLLVGAASAAFSAYVTGYSGFVLAGVFFMLYVISSYDRRSLITGGVDIGAKQRQNTKQIKGSSKYSPSIKKLL